VADLTPFIAAQREVSEASRPRPSHPTGWEPGIDTAKGVLTVQGGDRPPSDWAAIIAELGLPDTFEVDDTQPVQVRSWDGPGGQRLYYYRATVRPAGTPAAPDIDALIAQVKKVKRTPAQPSGADRALVVGLADWQAGKADHGGPEALLDRLFRLRDAVPERIRELKRAGTPIDRLYVIGLGDMIENCGNDHYAMQDFNTGQSGLDRRTQVKLVRRMLVELLTAWAPLVPMMVVGAVPGNHGENRRNGKAYTTFEDNDDLAVFEQVGEILAANPVFDHVRFVLADGDMSLTLDVAGVVCCFVHGHQFRGSGRPQQKAEAWLKGKMAARHRAGDAAVLCWGHYHHLVAVDDARFYVQAPALDGGSRWFEEGGGAHTKTGTVSFTCNADEGWDNLKVLR
jgi:predicted phosphodiesterase